MIRVVNVARSWRVADGEMLEAEPQPDDVHVDIVLHVDRCDRHDECVAIPEIGKACCQLDPYTYKVRVWLPRCSQRARTSIAYRAISALRAFGVLRTEVGVTPASSNPILERIREDRRRRDAIVAKALTPQRFGDEGFGRGR